MTAPITFSLSVIKSPDSTVDVTDKEDQCMKVCCNAFQIMDNSTPKTTYKVKPHVVIHLLHLNEIKVNFQEKGKKVDDPGVNDVAAVVSCIIDSLLKHLDRAGCVEKDRVEVVIRTFQLEYKGAVELKKKDYYPDYEMTEGKIAQVYADIRQASIVKNTRILIGLNDGSPETVGKIRAEFTKLFREGSPVIEEMGSF